MKKHWTSYITENFSYKMVALFISLILWLTILGRRDFVLSKKIDIELQTNDKQVVVAQTSDNIRVKVSGPRAALKKFMDNPQLQSIVIDISDRGEGVLDIDVPLNKIEVPMGVRILGVRPNVIRAEVANKKTPPEKTSPEKSKIGK
ncbi:MAG: CdaR family protein [Pseudobdellovibrionaceae bacterium]